MAENTNATNPFLSETEAKQVPAPVSAAPLASSAQNQATSPVSPKKPIEMAGPSLVSKKEDDFSSFPSNSRRKWIRLAIIILLILLIAGGVYWWWQHSSGPDENQPAEQSLSETPAPTTTPPVTEETVPLVLPDDLANYESENFKAGEIIFLGEAEFLLGDEGVEPLALEGIRGEAFTEKNKQEVKLVISWKTNKLSQAEIAYAKGIGQTPTVVSEDDYSYNHSMIITGLDPASTYLYTVKALDRFGNVATSEPYAVFTGARSVSLFDLIAGAIGDVFGWAVK